MTLNLVQHRGEPSIWDSAGRTTSWDAERWLLGAAAGAFVISGFRRRSLAGWLLVLGGGSIAWWAAAGIDERRIRRTQIRLAWPARQRQDCVREASEESFPASDAPSWTSTTGSSGHACDDNRADVPR